MNKKGFTLIELLAVIVILAIIALITVPVVINIINNAKKGAAEDSTYGVLGAVKYFLIQNYKDFENNNDDILFTCNSNGNCTTTLAGSTATTLELSGAKPTSGTIRIQKDGVTVTNLKFGDYYCSKPKSTDKVNCGTSSSTNNNEQNNEQNNELTPADIAIGTIVYFDPVSTNTCNATSFNLDSINNNESTCYKWRVIAPNTNQNTVTLQLDHGIGDDYVLWTDLDNEEVHLENGPIRALTTLSERTSSWTRLPLLNYTYNSGNATYNYGTLSCVEGTCTVTNNTEVATGLRTRLVTAEEITNIVNTVAENGAISKSWNLTSTSVYTISSNNTKPGTMDSCSSNDCDMSLAWLLENTTERSYSGATDNAYGSNHVGYWTLSPSSLQGQAWHVFRESTLSVDSAATESGIRPVITISKSLVSY